MPKKSDTPSPSTLKIAPSEETQAPVIHLKEDAIYYYHKALKSRGEVPPPTPNYDIDYTRQRPMPDIDIHKIDEVPIVNKEGIKFTIKSLGAMLGFDYYEYNLIQFWFMDILTDCVWKAQEVFHFDEDQLKVILLWVSTFFKIIADPLLNISRNNFLEFFKEVILKMYKEITKSDKFPGVDFIVDILQKQLNDTNQSDSESTTSDSSTEPSFSTFTINSKDRIKISPEFDIREHIRHLKSNNPLANSYYNYEETITESVVADEVEEEEDTLFNRSDIDFDCQSFDKPYSDIPAAFKSNHSGMQGIIPACKCKFKDQILSNLSGDENHEDYNGLLKVDIPGQLQVSKPSYKSHGDHLYSDMRGMSESVAILSYLTTNDLEMIVKSKSAVGNAKATDQDVHNESGIIVTRDLGEYVETVEHEKTAEYLEKQQEEEIMKEWAYFKLMEQRGWDMNNPKVGWVPWVSKVQPKKSEVNYGESEEILPEESTSTASTISNDDWESTRVLHFKMLKAIIDYVFEYFYENFHFTLIKLSFRSTPTTITQKLNEKWNVPKVIKHELKTPKPSKPAKMPKENKIKDKPLNKSKPQKADKAKKGANKKETKSPAKSKDDKADKKSVITAEEKKEMERQRFLEEKEEEARRRDEEDRVFMFPLADAASEDLFMNIFENWVKKAADTKTEKKGKTGKKGK